MRGLVVFLLLISLVFIGISLEPFDASHPLSVTQQCVQSLPACGGPVLGSLLVLLFVITAMVSMQSPRIVFPLDIYQFYDPLRGSPILTGLRKGRVARLFYN